MLFDNVRADFLLHIALFRIETGIVIHINR